MLFDGRQDLRGTALQVAAKPAPVTALAPDAGYADSRHAIVLR
jgi:hypothetical protein